MKTSAASDSLINLAKNTKAKELRAAFQAAFPHTIPMLTSVPVLGITYGVLMQTKGYGVLWSTLMSAIAFCGSMQFAAITMLTTAFTPIQAFLLSLLVNARHLFYGISMLDKYKGMGKTKGFLIYVMADETFSVCCTALLASQIKSKYFYFWVSFLVYFYWVAGTFLGGILGNFIKINTKGLDFTLTALFTVLFLEQWRKPKNRPAAIIGIVCSVISLLIFGRTNFIIPAMIFMVVLLMTGRKKLWS